MQGTDGNFYGTADNGCGPGVVYTLAPSGTGVEPATLTPTSTTYAQQVVVGATSRAKLFTLTNNQNVALNNIAIAAGGNFAVSSTTCTTSLAANSSCTIDVTFTPRVPGNRCGQLGVFDDASNSPQLAGLSGVGVAQATLNTMAAEYGAHGVGTTSEPKMFTLTNHQSVALNNIVIATTGDFAVSSTTCTTSLAAKSKCTIDVTFTPTALGTRTGQLSVSDSASNSPQTSTLMGLGVIPATLSPASATYAAQTVGTTSAARMFFLTNRQNAVLNNIVISTTGDFAVSSTTCTTSLGGDLYCSISVTFTPTATRMGQLRVSDNANNSPQTSKLTGTGK